MLYNSCILLLMALTASAQDPVYSLQSRSFTEYLMPPTPQTHELARVPDSNFVLLTQMSDSELIKIELDPTTEEPVAYAPFLMGEDSHSALHGVWPSKVFPGKMWLSLQAENKLLLVDPGEDLSTAPSIEQTIEIPSTGKGPHCVIEIGDRIWAGLKEPSDIDEKYYVFSADVNDPTDQEFYECEKSPVFMAEEPTTGFIYVTQDDASSIMRIDVPNNETEQLPIPDNEGSIPVGMIAADGPLSGVWFTLAGDTTGGTGTFGRIGSSGELEFFHLENPLGAHAGLLHVADASSSTEDGPALWLLSTSLLSEDSRDVLIHVTFDEDVTSISSEEYIFLPTQNAKSHRILPLDNTVLVSELNVFTIAQLTYNNAIFGHWPPTDTENVVST